MEWYNPDPAFYISNPSFRLLECTLRSSDRIQKLIQYDQFAQGLADILASSVTELCTLDGCILLWISSDDCRGLVAHLRGRGETHHEFSAGIISYPAKYDSDNILAELELLGWRVPSKKELSALLAIVQAQ